MLNEVVTNDRLLYKGKENELWTDSNKNSKTKQFNT